MHMSVAKYVLSSISPPRSHSFQVLCYLFRRVTLLKGVTTKDTCTFSTYNALLRHLTASFFLIILCIPAVYWQIWLPVGMWGEIHCTLLQPVIPSVDAKQQVVITAQCGVTTSFLYFRYGSWRRQIRYYRLLLNLLSLIHCLLNHKFSVRGKDLIRINQRLSDPEQKLHWV